MTTPNKRAYFEHVFLPHLDAAYNLARWLTRSEQDAEDIVQEAYLRAFKYFDGFRGTDSRSWLLAIVRNTCFTWKQHELSRELTIPFEEDAYSDVGESGNPEELLMQSISRQELKEALEALPTQFREIIVLRELEDLSYKEIAAITHLPLGTVMSRLARARKRLQHALTGQKSSEKLAEEGGVK